MTRNSRAGQLTIERLTHDCLDVRFLRREGFFADGGVTVGATLKWPSIARMRIARYRLILDLRGHMSPNKFASHGRECISAANGPGCIARTARAALQGFTRGWEATSAALALVIHPTRPSG